MIKHISFYKNGKRVIKEPGPTGLFSIVVEETNPSGYSPLKEVQLSAAGIVSHRDWKDCDPTLNLKDGRKLRVYNAGNSHAPIVYPSLVIEEFDKKWREKREKLNATSDRLKKEAKERKEQITQPMAGAPIIPPPPPSNKKVKVANGPPQKSTSSNKDPFSSVIDSWYGADDDDDYSNDGLDDGDDW